MQPSDIDIPQQEKVAFIAYNIGVFESVQKFGNLITSGKITGGMDPAAVAKLLEETRAFYDSEMIAQLINSMIAGRSATTSAPAIVNRITAGEVDNVIRQLTAAGVRLSSSR